jgi:hypothetical protein
MSAEEREVLLSEAPGVYAWWQRSLGEVNCHLVRLPEDCAVPLDVKGLSVVSISDEIATRLFGKETPFLVSITSINRFYGNLQPLPSLPCANGIRMIRVPKGIDTILNGAFRGLPNLESVTFEVDSRIDEIDGFCCCPLLGFVVLPASLRTIGPLGFSDCHSLRYVRFAGCTESTSEYQKKYSTDVPPPPKAERARRHCAITTISGFNQCLMKDFTVPWSVTKIDGFNGEAMNGELCVGICAVSFEPGSELKEIHGFSPPAQAAITIPDSVKVIGKTAFVGDVSVDGSESRSLCVLEKIVFGKRSLLERVLGIRHCPRLEPVTLYERLTKIGDQAFTSCGSPGSDFVVTLVTSCVPKMTDVPNRIIRITKGD